MVRKTKKRKIAAKVLAAILSVTTGLSTMSSFQAGAVAFAQEATEADLPAEEVLGTEEDEVLVDETTDAASEEAGYADDAAESEEAEEADDNETVVSDEEAEASEDEVTSEKVEDTAVEKDSLKLSNSDDLLQAREFDASKTDVWDFGAENLGEDYNNRLDAKTINSFYPEVEAGSTSKNIASFSVDDGDFVFEDGGFPTTHRIRSMNENITRYDAKSLKDSDGNVFNGYL